MKLESEMKTQLANVFQQLENEITLVMTSSIEAEELENLLSDISSVSSKIKWKKEINSKNFFQGPQFYLEKNNRPMGIVFSGIPGGHEFTSLILAILHGDGKGRWPDEYLKARIKNIKGPIRVKTFVSLTCENCPEVVQTLNQMALIHSDFHSEIVDGSYAPKEVERLHIQGVPAVLAGDVLIHSGRADFMGLLTKLEKHFGVVADNLRGEVKKDLGHFKVAVIGGGPAGASAAIYSARKGLKTALVAERMGGQVMETKGIENLISVIYTEGPQLGGQLEAHIAQYPIEVFQHRRVKSIKKILQNEPIKYEINFETGEILSCRSLIVTTGAQWRKLNIPGEENYLTKGVAFCPTCDGPFYKGKIVAVIGGGNSGVEAAIDLAGIVQRVILFEYQDSLKADEILVRKLMSFPNVEVITSARTMEIKGNGVKVTGLTYQDRKSEKIISVDLSGVFIQIGLSPNSQLVKGLVDINAVGEIVVDSKGRTSSPGIYAAGDVTNVAYKQIIIAMGEGAKASLAVFEDQMLE